MLLLSTEIQLTSDCPSGLWRWLTSGQNATAVGVIAATALSGFSLYVLWRTLNAVNKQAIAADRQAKAAEEQVKAASASAAVSEAQRIAVEESAKANRLQSELIRHQTLAQLRPVLVFGIKPHITQAAAWVAYIENHGVGAAFNISVQFLRSHTAPNGPITEVSEVASALTVLGANQQSWIDHLPSPVK